jgi:hypothetical protein
MPSITLTQPTFDELRAIFVANPQAQPPIPGPVAPVINANLFKPDGARYSDYLYVVNELATPGQAGTTTMPLTGHVLSNPWESIGELLIGYYLRTSKQTGGDPNAAGGLIVYQQGYAGQPWQVIVDSYGVRNPAVAHPAGWVDPYAPQPQPAPQGGSGNGGTGPIVWGPLNDQDKAYAIATFKRRHLGGTGVDVPAAMAAAFNGAGDWSIWEGNNEPLVANIDLAAYAGPLKGEL